MNDVAAAWAEPKGAGITPDPPKARVTRIGWVVIGVAVILAVGSVVLLAVGLVEAGDLSGRCAAEAERDFQTHRQDVLPLLPDAEPASVEFVNDCDSGGAALTTASTAAVVTEEQALLGLRQAGWDPLEDEQLRQYGEVGAVVTHRIGDSRVVVIADQRPDDNPVTQITIHTEH